MILVASNQFDSDVCWLHVSVFLTPLERTGVACSLSRKVNIRPWKGQQWAPMEKAP